MASVEFSNISKAYGPQQILRQVTLNVIDGEFLTLLGPSGCGKSTLLRVLAGLTSHDEGSVALNGAVVDRLRPKQRNIAMVFQSYALYPHMTVGQNIALPLRMRRLGSLNRLPFIGRLLPRTKRVEMEIHAAVQTTAEALGIDHLLDRKPAQLSGGQRQRVAVGRAMVRHPAVFLMDEPLSNLDAKLRVQMRTEIKELHRRLGVTFIYVTHDQSEAMTLSDRVGVMLDGELLQVATPQDIYNDPADRRVAEFVGSPKINIIESTMRDHGVVDVAGSTLALQHDRSPGERLTLGIRPEALHLAERPGVGTLTGSVGLVEHMGSDLFVHVAMPGVSHPVVARLPAERAQQIEAGRTVSLGVRPHRVLMFDRDGSRIRAECSNTPDAPSASVTPIREFA